MPVNQELKNIINEIKYHCDLKQSEIAEELGIKSTYLSDMINGRVPFSDSIKKNIYEVFSGRMNLIKEKPEIKSNLEESSEIPILQTEMMLSSVKVPYYDVDFAGGWTSYELSTQTTPTFIISSPDFARAEFACNLIGNSISNRIKNGSIIGLRRIVDWQVYFPTNELYGVITKNDLRTVKIVKRSKKEGFLELIPDALPEFNNPPYEPEIIPIDYIVDFYQVVAYAFFERLAF